MLKGSLEKSSVWKGLNKLSQLRHLELNFAAPESVQSLKPNKRTKVTWQLSTCSAGTAVMVQVNARFLHVSSEE